MGSFTVRVNSHIKAYLLLICSIKVTLHQTNTTEETIFVKMSFCHSSDFSRQKMYSPNTTSSTKYIFFKWKRSTSLFYVYITVKMCLLNYDLIEFFFYFPSKNVFSE